MSITHIFISYPNKSQPYNKKLIERLLDSKVKVKVISFTNEKKNTPNKVISLEHKPLNWFKYLTTFFRDTKDFFKFKRHTNLSIKNALFLYGRYSLMKLETKSLIHIHHIQLLNNELLSFLKIKKNKIILSFRGSDLLVRPLQSMSKRNNLLNILKKVDAIHTVSSNLKDVTVNYGFDKSKVFVIRRTVEVNNKISVKLNKESKYQITTIARLHWTKGYVLALKALGKLKVSGVEFTYTICGSKEEAIYDELLFWVNKLNLIEEVNFVGHLSSRELDNILSITDVYMQTSLSEGIPNTLLRCLVNRIPILTTNVGGIPEVFRDKIDGVLVEKLNEQNIFIGLKKLLEDSNLREQIINSESNLELDYKKEIELYKKMYTQVNTYK